MRLDAVLCLNERREIFAAAEQLLDDLSLVADRCIYHRREARRVLLETLERLDDLAVECRHDTTLGLWGGGVS